MADNAKESYSRKENSFRLHYFPEIPTSFNNQKKRVPENESCFKQSDCTMGASLAGHDPHHQQELTPEEKIQQQVDEAYKAGFEKGIEEGKASERLELNSCFQSAQKLIVDFDSVRKEIAESAEIAAVQLALHIAGKVLRTEPKADPQIILKVAGPALRKVMDHSNITVRINPSDLDMLQKHQEDLKKSINAKKDIRFEPDGSVEPGGCYIETDFGDIDARMESQFKVIAEALTQELTACSTGSDTLK